MCVFRSDNAKVTLYFEFANYFIKRLRLSQKKVGVSHLINERICEESGKRIEEELPPLLRIVQVDIPGTVRSDAHLVEEVVCVPLHPEGECAPLTYIAVRVKVPDDLDVSTDLPLADLVRVHDVNVVLCDLVVHSAFKFGPSSC